MAQTIYTFPGKGGDAILQWPVAWLWARQTGKRFTAWLDENTCRMVAPLFEAQPCCEAVEFKKGVESYNMGGQPFHFDLPTSAYEGRNIFHLGLRHFPARQLTLEAFEQSNVPVELDQGLVGNTPCFEVEPLETVLVKKGGVDTYYNPASKRICLLHGQSVYAHTRSTPGFWPFIHSIRNELQSLFDEVIFVGSDRDREVGTRTYPYFTSYDDEGSFLNLAKLMVHAKLVIGVGSSVVTLGGSLKVPTIRVHDPIGEHAKTIWDNLGDNQANLTEVDLRRDWPEFRDRWVKKEVSNASQAFGVGVGVGHDDDPGGD